MGREKRKVEEGEEWRRTCELGEHVLHVGGDALTALHEFVDDTTHPNHFLTRRDHAELQVLRMLNLRNLKHAINKSREISSLLVESREKF